MNNMTETETDFPVECFSVRSGQDVTDGIPLSFEDEFFLKVGEVKIFRARNFNIHGNDSGCIVHEEKDGPVVYRFDFFNTAVTAQGRHSVNPADGNLFRSVNSTDKYLFVDFITQQERDRFGTNYHWADDVPGMNPCVLICRDNGEALFKISKGQGIRVVFPDGEARDITNTDGKTLSDRRVLYSPRYRRRA